MIRLMEYESTLIGNGGEQRSFLELAHNSDRRHPPHSLARPHPSSSTTITITSFSYTSCTTQITKNKTKSRTSRTSKSKNKIFLLALSIPPEDLEPYYSAESRDEDEDDNINYENYDDNNGSYDATA